MRLKDKVAVVTGGSSGMGRAIALAFAGEGARVAISGRNQSALEAVRDELGGDALAVQSDVTSVPDLDRLYAAVTDHFGSGIDVLVANAGVGKLAPIEALDEETFDWMSGINFKGVFFTVRQAVPHLNEGASRDSDFVKHSAAGRAGLLGVLRDEGGCAIACAQFLCGTAAAGGARERAQSRWNGDPVLRQRGTDARGTSRLRPSS